MSGMLLTESPSNRIVLKTREVSGFVLIETLYRARTKVRNHSHAEANMCIALKGTCTEIYGNKVRQYEPLALDYLPAEATHSLEFPSTELHSFCMEIAPQWLERMREISLFQAESVHCQGGLLANLFIRLYREFHTADGASSIAIEGLALEMLAEVSRRQCAVRERLPAWLRQAVELLHAHFSETLKLASVAQAVGVHPVHLARVFRKHYRCTVGEYIRQLRIENACHALSKTDMTLSAIASATGFADQSHFGRTFKRFTGMSPAEYRALTSSR
jgi:AraC family transcriptional regulator